MRLLSDITDIDNKTPNPSDNSLESDKKIGYLLRRFMIAGGSKQTFFIQQ